MNKQQIFLWQGISPNGQLIKGEISAATLNLARHYLLKKKIQPSSIVKKPHQFFSSRITTRDRILFFRQLATLFNAGIPITQAISLLRQNTKSNKFAELLLTLNEDLNSGKNFTDSLKKFPRYFDKITCNLIAAGEKTGTFDLMLEQVAAYQEKSAELKNKIFQALFYPCTIILVAIITTIIMLTFIVPRFVDLFQTMHASLPAFTLIVIYFAHFFQLILPYFLLLLSLIVIAIYYGNQRDQYKLKLDKLITQLPVIGSYLQKFVLARFTRTLATIFASGIPITEALQILAHSTGNLNYRNAILKLSLEIQSGKHLHLAMQKQPLFPLMMLQMIAIGEESGTLEKMLHKIADFFESDIDHLIAILNKLLEPLIMIVLGVLIGGLVIAMYLPIFKLGNVF